MLTHSSPFCRHLSLFVFAFGLQIYDLSRFRGLIYRAEVFFFFFSFLKISNTFVLAKSLEALPGLSDLKNLAPELQNSMKLGEFGASWSCSHDTSLQSKIQLHMSYETAQDKILGFQIKSICGLDFLHQTT